MDASRYFQFAAVADVTVLRLGTFGQMPSERSYHGTYREIVVPRSQQHVETEALVSANVPFDLSIALLVRLLSSTPAYGEALRALSEHIDFCLVAESAFGDVAAATVRVPLIYDASRIESCVPAVAVTGTIIGSLLEDLKTAEKRLCERAATVIVRGDDDAKSLRDTLAYSHDPAVISTGIAHDAERYRTAAQRRTAKTVMKFGERAVVVFEGDGSVESIRGMSLLGEIAKQQPDVMFIVIGPYPPGDYPPNMRMLGSLIVEDVLVLRNLADIGVVPYEVTSGTPAQVVDFVLAGVPLIASPSALKNMPLAVDRDLLAGPPDTFSSLIARTLADPVAAEARSVSALAAVLAAFPPTLTAINFHSLIERLHSATPVTA